jgi:hypothetical protein
VLLWSGVHGITPGAWPYLLINGGVTNVSPNRSAITAPAKSLKVVQSAPARGRKPGLSVRF